MPASERRQQILDAAVVVFAANGYRDVGTAAVAAEAGVSEPTLYRYFDSKRELYLAMLERNAERLLSSWRKLADDSPDPMAALVAIGRDYARQLETNTSPFLLRARSLLETGDVGVEEHARKQFWATFDFVRGIYERARESGQIAADSDSRSLAWMYMAVGGLLDQFLLMGLEPPAQEEMARMMAVVLPQRPNGEDLTAAPQTGRTPTKERR